MRFFLAVLVPVVLGSATVHAGQVEWRQARGNPTYDGFSDVVIPSSGLVLTWSVSGHVGVPIVTANHVILNSTANGTLEALSVTDGSTVWQASVLGGLLTKQPAAAEGRIYVAASSLTISYQAFDEASGERLWVSPEDPFAPAHRDPDHTVFVPSAGSVWFFGRDVDGSDTIVSLDAATGGEPDNYPFTAPDTRFIPATRPVVRDTGIVYAGSGLFPRCSEIITEFYGLGLNALDRISTMEGHWYDGATVGGPILATPNLLIRYSESSGNINAVAWYPSLTVRCPIAPVWTFAVSGITANSVAEGANHLVVLAGSTASVLNTKSGAVMATVSLPVAATTGPTITNGSVLYGDQNGDLHVLNWNTLVETAVFHVTNASIVGDIAVTTQGIFVAASNGTVIRIGPEGCKTRSPGYPQNGHQGIGPGGVNTLSGNVVFSVQDVSIPLAGVSIKLNRTYNSQRAESVSQFTASGTQDLKAGGAISGTPFVSALGPGWTHSYQVAVLAQIDGATGTTLMVEERGDGREVGFTISQTGMVMNPPGIEDAFKSSLTGTPCGAGVCLQHKRGVVRSFSPEGDLSSITDPDGNTVQLTYTPTAAYKPGASGNRLVSIQYLSSTLAGSSGTGCIGSGCNQHTETVTFEYGFGTGLLTKVQSPNPSGGAPFVTTYTYFAGLLTGVTGPDGIYHATYRYNAQDRMFEKIDPRAPEGLKKLVYQYDAEGRVAAVKTIGQKLIASYDYTGAFLTPVQVADGVTNSHETTVTQFSKIGRVQTVYTYDDCNLLRSVRDGLGHETSYAWDARLHLTQVTDANGHSTTYFYDSRGNVISTVDAVGNSTFTNYEPAFNRPTLNVDANANKTEFFYDAAGNVVTTLQYKPALPAPLDEAAAVYSTGSAYDGRGLKVYARDANGHETFFEYDGAGNLIAESHRLILSPTTSTDFVTRNEYDLLGRLTATTDANGSRSEFQYDAENRKIFARLGISVASATGLQEVSYSYDSLNRLIQQTGGCCQSKTYAYDEQDHELSVTDALNHVTTNEWDTAGNRTAVIDPNNHKTQFSYDADFRLVRVTDAKGGTAIYGYDPAGNQVSTTDPNGRVTRYGYDSLNRLVSVTYPDSQTEFFSYDPVGNRIEKRDSRGVKVIQTYDALNRLRRVQSTILFGPTPAAPDSVYFFDPVGNRVKTTTQVGAVPYVVDDVFDSLNRLTQENIGSNGSTLATKRMDYDRAGNRVLFEVDAPTTAATDLRIGYSYDAQNRVLSVSNTGKQVTNQYDPLGRLVHSTLPNGIAVRRSYDEANRLTKLRNERLSSGAAMSFQEYVYDNAMNRKSMRNEAGLTAYAYDDLDRLTAVDAPAYYDFSYSYDPAGNRLGSQKMDVAPNQNEPPKVYSYQAANELTKVQMGGADTTYTWDAAGNLAGRVVNPGNSKTSYSFDSLNRMIGVALPAAVVAYGYDCDAHRVLQRTGGLDTWFVFDGLSVVMELGTDKKPTAVMVPGVSKTRIDLPTPLIEYYLFDGLGSVVQLTDELGNLTQEYQYEPFGLTQDNATDRFNRYRYVGLASDDLTGLTYMNARWYDPNVGRFLSRDPLFPNLADTQSTVSYVYARNSPVVRSDLTGMACGSGWTDPLIPDAVPGAYDFSAPCSAHDACYDTVGAEKGACDSSFLSGCLASCQGKEGMVKQICEKAAQSYYTAVAINGQKAYDDAQDAALLREIMQAKGNRAPPAAAEDSSSGGMTEVSPSDTSTGSSGGSFSQP